MLDFKVVLILSLFLVAQLHVPDYERCTLEFMKQLLAGTKKALPLHKIRPVRVTERRYITVKRVVAQVKDNENWMRYLPDHPAAGGRQFLFNVVNTLDPEYFVRAQGEVERMRIAEAQKEAEQQVVVCPEMQRILEEHSGLAVDRKSKPNSLAALKLGAKKRQKVERLPIPELQTRVKQIRK